jgi:PAS domain S-box-containing protein
MQTRQYVLYLVMIYGASFLFIYLVDAIHEHLPVGRASYRDVVGGLLVGMVAPFIQWVIQGVNHPVMPLSMPDGRFLVIMIATVYYRAQGGAAAMITVWAGSLLSGYPQVAFLFIHGLWLYAVGLVLRRLSLKIPYNRHILLVMGGTAVTQIGSIPTVSFLVPEGSAETYFKSLPFVFVALEAYTAAISLIFIHNRERQEQILNATRSEQRLRESEEKFSTIFHAGPVGIGITRVSDNKIMEVNDAFLRLFGFEREEVIGKSSFELNLWVREEERVNWLDVLAGQEKSKSFETRFRSKSGEAKDVRITADIIYIGEEQLILSLVEDITESKRAEEALVDARKYLDKIINSISDPLFVKDRRHRWVLANDALCSFMGQTREDILGKSDYDYFPGEEADVFWAKDEEVFTSGLENVNEETITDARGNIHTVVTNKTLFTDDKGEQFIVAVIRDITDRKIAEDALLESETQYRTLVETSLVGVYIIQDNLFRFVNRRFCEIFGRSYDEIVNKLGPRDITHPDDIGTVEEHIRRRIAREIDAIEYEFRIIRKDGTTSPVRVIGRSMLYHGRMAVLGTLVDLTEQKRSEEEKARLEAQLFQAQKMESIGTLAGGIAHDFNNILAAIIGFSELAISDLSDPAKAKRELEQVLKASERAKDLVHQILTFSRKTEQVYSPLAIPPLVKESLKMLRSVIPSTIEIRQELIDSGLVMSNPTEIHQLVMNLCINAAQAMDRTGGVLSVGLAKVAVGADKAKALEVSPGPYLKLTVNDNGHGMPAEVVKRIFEPYFTTKEVGHGTGLGLSVVHGIVKSHGGAVTCESRPYIGTTFDVYLPEVELIEEEAPDRIVDDIPEGTERILFIDDESAIADMAGEILSNLGYTVKTETNSLRALNLFKANPDRFDLVITDMTMPGMTGDMLARKIMEIRSDLPIIICSGYSEHISEERAKSMGIREYIAKPFELRKLARKIRRALDQK